MTPAHPQVNAIPESPRLVLRIGFAGNCNRADDATEALVTTIQRVLETIAGQLVELEPGQPQRPDQPRISLFHAPKLPLLRLITGLAEGADALAAQALDRVAAQSPMASRFATELAAVLASLLLRQSDLIVAAADRVRSTRPAARWKLPWQPTHRTSPNGKRRCAWVMNLVAGSSTRALPEI